MIKRNINIQITLKNIIVVVIVYNILNSKVKFQFFICHFIVPILIVSRNITLLTMFRKDFNYANLFFTVLSLPMSKL